MSRQTNTKQMNRQLSNKYFKKYLKIAPLSLAIWRASEADRFNKVKLSPPILDIGCGFGEFAQVFFDVPIDYGIDINFTDIQQAKNTGKYKQLILSDGRKLPFKNNSISTVLSVSVLEHISNVERVFMEVERVLKPGGIFAFSVPTIDINEKLYIPQILRLLKLKILSEKYLKIFHKTFKHELIVKEGKWKSLVNNSRLKIVDIEPTITYSQIFWFEMTLPFALPSQLFRNTIIKRLPFSPQWRITLLSNIYKNHLFNEPISKANIFIRCYKPKK